MQLEDLQLQWKRLDQKLDQSLILEKELIQRVLMQPARRRVHRLAFWPAIDVAACIGVLLLGAAFLRGHWREAHVAAPAAALMISVFVLLIDSVRQLQRVAELDWSGPVAAIQNSLEKLRVARIRQFKWIILLAPLVGFCGLMVSLHWIFAAISNGRAGILDKIDPAWIAANYAFGVLFVPLGYFVARILAQRCHGHRWWQAVLDDISGKSLKAATRDVELWAGFQEKASARDD